MPKKVILISGGSDGLGKAIAQKLSPNHQVVILARNEENLKKVSEEIACDFVVGDVTNYDSLEKAVFKVIEKHQTVDVLINNAGVWTEGDLEDTDVKKIDEIFAVNTLGTIYLSKIVIPRMKSQKSGRIINIISQDGLKAKKKRSIYTASKWAITGFTKSLVEDLSPLGIGVTGIYPGLLKTNLFEKQGESRNLKNALELSEVATLVEYVINLSTDTLLPDISIKNINNQTTMDDVTAPQIGLDINPDMITPQSGFPAATPATPSVEPVTPSTGNPSSGVIDITPGAPDISHPPKTIDISPTDSAPVSTPGINLPVDQGVIDITPDQSPVSIDENPGVSHLSDMIPESPTPSSPVTPTQIEETPSIAAPVIPTPGPAEASVASPAVSPDLSVTPAAPVVTTPVTNVAVTPETATTAASPFAEDPDTVKLA